MVVSFMGRLMTCSIVIVFIAAMIMAFKALLKHHLSLRAQYRLWFPFLLILAIPFVPLRLRLHTAAFGWLDSVKSGAGGMITRELAGMSGMNGNSGGWLRDFSVSVSRQTPEDFYRVMLFIWAAGALFMAAVTVSSGRRVKRLKQASLPLQNRQLQALYQSCRQELHIKRDIPVLSTAYLQTPVTAGVLRPCIIIPIHIITELPQNELRFILMHELLHCKYKDTLINQLACLAQILYWFHPVVWLAVKELRRDGESACDGAVLARLETKDYTSYGNTLIRFAARLSGISYTSAAGIGGKAGDLKKRILGIRNYRRERRRDKLKGAAVLMLVTALVLGAVPSITSNADTDSSYTLASDRVTEVDLGSYFRGYDGCFVLYDTNADAFSIYNREAALKRVPPASTYKIYSALTALQAGIITPDSNLLAWDHTEYPFEEWNQDHTLSSAMKNSVNWYFNDLDRRSGTETLKQSLDAVHYGNQDISGGPGQFWMESSLKISPAEQVRLLSQLEDGTLPFDRENIQAVKEALYLSDTGNMTLYGKTGTGTVNDEDINGWFVGMAETEQNTYVFAVNIQGEKGAGGSVAGQIALDILDDTIR